MRAARWIFAFAGIYGILVLLPGYFMEGQVAAPPLNHPEFYYGFYGCALAWQFAFLLIARDPVGLRMLMPVAMLEKVTFFVAGLVLYAKGRLALGGPFYGSLFDGVLLTLFIVAWLRTPKTN